MPFRPVWYALVLLVGVGGAPVAAQGVASTFDQLSVLVKSGDAISLVDSTGRETKGRIDKLSAASLTLVTGSGSRELRETDVAMIRQRRSDPLMNGAIIGALVGSGLALTIVATLLEHGDSTRGAAIGTAIYAGLGAAVGTSVDALIRGQRVIYRKPGAAGDIGVSPLLLHGRKGVAVSVRF